MSGGVHEFLANVVVSVGSNCGDRAENVRGALEWLSAHIMDTRCSDIYETPEIHGKGSPYMNAVLVGSTPQDIAELNASFKKYELSQGRDADARAAGMVPIDVDIVVWNGEVIRPGDYAATFFKLGYGQLRRD